MSIEIALRGILLAPTRSLGATLKHTRDHSCIFPLSLSRALRFPFHKTNAKYPTHKWVRSFALAHSGLGTGLQGYYKAFSRYFP